MSVPLTALRSYLRTIRWSGSDLARAIGCTPAYANGVIAGTRAPSRAFVRDAPLILGPILGVDPDDLRRILFDKPDKPDIGHGRSASVLERHLAALTERKVLA